MFTKLYSASCPYLKPCNLKPDRNNASRIYQFNTFKRKLLGPVAHVSASPVQHQDNSENNGSNGNNGNHGRLDEEDFAKFVHFFRQATPYISGHRGKTFVIIIPGQITVDEVLFKSVINDIATLHGMGVNIVVVLGCISMLSKFMQEKGFPSRFVGEYRVTDKETLDLAIEAAGHVRTRCEKYLSQGPAIPMIRRHTKGDSEIHFEPALKVVSGNYICAKRRGVVDGIDFGYTGEVRFVMKDDIRKQMELGNIVLLCNLGFTVSGEVLNCNSYDVGLHTAVELGADKLFYLHLDDVATLKLPAWLPLGDAQKMLVERMQARSATSKQVSALMSSMAEEDDEGPISNMRPPANQVVVDLDVWSKNGFPMAVPTCVVACSRGVRRAHLLDARLDGGLLLELYSRDGVGTMISADFYEGIRPAIPRDLSGILALLAPLEKAGVLAPRTPQQVAELVPNFIVIERETRVLGCALLVPLGSTDDGVSVAEVGAFVVDPTFRGSGRGDSLLDYVEQAARGKGIRRLVLLTTRTADWFEQRSFSLAGPAYENELLPPARRAVINPSRNSQLYVKNLESKETMTGLPGKRIGF